MKTNKRQNTDLMKLSLYLISLWILFFMLIILKIDLSMIPFKIKWDNVKHFIWQNSVPCLCLFFIFLGGIGYCLFIDSLNNAKKLPVTIVECEGVNYENLSFLATYIIPLVCFPMNNKREIFVMFSVVIIIGCIFVKTDLYYTNPSLVLLGFNIYKVKTNSKGGFQQGVVIVKGKLKRGEKITYLALSENVYYGRKAANED